MYLMGFSNLGVRPTGNLELVELSLGNKYHPPELLRKQLQCSSNGKYSRVITTATTATVETSQSQSNCNSNITSSSSSNGAAGSPRKAKRVSLEDLQQAVEPELSSPAERWVPSEEEEETPVNWLQEDLASGQLAQEWWSFCIGKPKNDAKKRNLAFTSTTFESVFADGGISIRVEHHPLESSSSSSSSSSEDEFLDARDGSEAASEQGYTELLQHLESIEKAKLVPLQQEGDATGDEGYAELLQHLESIVKAKVSELQQEGDATGDEAEDLRRAQVPIPSPKSTTVPSAFLAFSPSLLSPILEKMEDYSWGNDADREDSQGFLADHEKCGISNDLLSEMSTSGGDRDVEKTCKHSPTNVDALLNLKALDLYSRRRGDTKTSTPKVVEVHVGEAVESQQDYPSPSSFTCGMSFTSLFSDDEDPFPLSVSNNNNDTIHAFDKHFCSELVNPHDNHRNGSSRKSPRSVLSQEPDEISHGTSDSSETATKKLHPRKQQHQQVHNYMYNDESSDLDSPMQSGFKYELPIPAAFIYEASMDMGATTTSSEDSSSDEDEDEDHVVVAAAGSLQELGIFQEANQREPWLVNDRGGVLDDSEEDLEFLLSPTSLHTRSPLRNGLPSLASQKMPETTGGRIKHGSPKTIDGTPKTHHGSSKTHQESPKTHQESPKTHLESPKTHPESPKTHPESPKTHPGSPKTHHESPKTHHESPKTHPESPKTHPESPKTHPESPKTEHESLKCKDETLKTKYESANSKHESPKTKDETLKTKYDRSKVKREHESPKTKHGSPKTKHGSPKTKHGSPKTTDEIRKTKYEGPSTKHDSMRRPISDNKWVPYVTSRLYDDGSPRAQRNPIKRPQIPILDNPAYGGKTSVTKGEFDKAPKRSVNFAVDLVKEIPYTTTPTTNLKPNVIAPPTKKPWEVEVEEEEGPSIMTSHRNRWRRNRDNVAVVDDSKSNSNANAKTTTPSPGGSTRWSTWTKERVAHAVPSCTGKLLSWPKKLAFKVSNSKRWNVDSDEDSFVGDGSFGVSARRDAELVRRILKGSQKKYSNLNETEIMRGDFR